MTKLGAAAAMLIGATVTGTAQPSAAAEPCGYYETSSYAYYNHCGPTTILIKVDRNWPSLDTTQCVRPGTTGLGTASAVNSAWYIGGAGCS